MRYFSHFASLFVYACVYKRISNAYLHDHNLTLDQKSYLYQGCYSFMRLLRSSTNTGNSTFCGLDQNHLISYYLYTQTYTNMENLNPNQVAGKAEPKEMIRVSVSEAAKLFGVTSQTIRRAIASQEITYIIVGDRYKINFESLIKWSQLRTTVKNKLAKRGIGQFVERWKIKNPLYSPNPKTIEPKKAKVSE